MPKPDPNASDWQPSPEQAASMRPVPDGPLGPINTEPLLGRLTMSDAREVVARSMYEAEQPPPLRWSTAPPLDRAAYLDVADAALADLSDHVREHGPLSLGHDCVVVGREPTDAMVEAFINGAFDRGHGSGHAAVKAGLRAALRSPDPGEGT